MNYREGRQRVVARDCGRGNWSCCPVGAELLWARWQVVWGLVAPQYKCTTTAELCFKNSYNGSFYVYLTIIYNQKIK